MQEMEADTRHIQALEQRLREGIQSRLQGVVLNGPEDLQHRYSGNLNLSFAYVEGESLIMGLKVNMHTWCCLVAVLLCCKVAGALCCRVAGALCC